MIAVFLPPFAFRGVSAPYLWVFYKFLQTSSEPMLFIIGDEYSLGSADLIDAQRWEFLESSQQRLGYSVPTKEQMELHELRFLPQDIFERLLDEHGRNPRDTFKTFLTQPISYLTREIEKILNEYDSNLEAIVSWCNCGSLSEAAATRNVPIIHLELGPLRDPIYRPTMYLDFSGVNGNTEAELRYQKNGPLEPINLSTSRLRNFFLQARQEFDTLSAPETADSLKTGVVFQVEDDSNLVAFGKNFDNRTLLSLAQLGNPTASILVRNHPGSLFDLKDRQFTIDRSETSPEFIARCREIITINSSVGFEALLLSKHVHVLGECSYKFIADESSMQVKVDKMAFYLFCYLVPAELGFDLDYLRFRLNTKDEAQIAQRHLSAYSSYKQKMINTGSTGDMIEREVQAKEILLLSRTLSELDSKLTQSAADTHCYALQVEEARLLITEMRESTSWKITAPLRFMRTQMLYAATLKTLILQAKQHSGSYRTMVQKAYAVCLREGLRGVQSRVNYLADKQNRPPVSTTAVVGRTKHQSEIARHTRNVDLIICVHNALDDVKICLKSISEHTLPPYRIILVDDGSDDETRDFLVEYAKTQRCLLHRNNIAAGYTKAANCGLRLSHADSVVMLNSDTIVTPYWLDRLVNCAEHDSAIGLVGPLSNTASWQSVPHVFDEQGDWCENPIPCGVTIQDFASEIARESQQIFPEVGFINGFCLYIKRDLLREIGLFDEDNFGSGYGEENDYCLRASIAGWKLAIADDAYVYHSQSKSYSHERRLELSQAAGGILARKHGQSIIDQQLTITAHHPALEYIRTRSQLVERKVALREQFAHYQGKRILFALPVGSPGGGGNIVLLEARRLIGLGVDAQIVNLACNEKAFERGHPTNTVPIHYISSPTELSEIAQHFDAVIATLYTTVEWLRPVASAYPDKIFAYYIQDFEPDFFPVGSDEYTRALASYQLLDGIRLMTKTEWNRSALHKHLGVDCHVIGSDFDDSTFYPAAQPRSPGSALVISAMVRPTTPRRAPELTMRILKRLKAEFGSSISVRVFGGEQSSDAYRNLTSDFEHQNLGEISNQDVSNLLRCTDIFVDYSEFQAMGLTAMEASASGAIVVAPLNGGCSEIITDNETGILVNTSNEEQCYSKTRDLVRDSALQMKLRKNCLSVTRFFPEQTALNLLNCLFDHDKRKD